MFGLFPAGQFHLSLDQTKLTRECLVPMEMPNTLLVPMNQSRARLVPIMDLYSSCLVPKFMSNTRLGSMDLPHTRLASLLTKNIFEALLIIS